MASASSHGLLAFHAGCCQLACPIYVVVKAFAFLMLQDAEEETLLVFLATSKEKEEKHEDAAKYFSLAAKASVLAQAVQRNRDLAKVTLLLLQLTVWLLVYPLVCPCVCQHPRPFIKALWDMHVLIPYSCMSPGEYMC